MKLGSLFDGIGGFPHVATMLGIEPVWASEIEKFPIAVTKIRFPNMKHLGSVCDIKGAEVEPVDIITFGSPCQDLSVAGKRAGMGEGTRSGLFSEAVRIIKEMRGASCVRNNNDERPQYRERDISPIESGNAWNEFCSNDGGTNDGNKIFPRYAVWENVPGAYSSNGGEDFRAVIESLAKIAEETVSIPMPKDGKWEPAGLVEGDGWSIAWRTLDAQFWGVPQRRKRIFLVADFGGQCASEIFFERESVSGNIEESGNARKEAAGGVEGGTCFAIQGNIIDRADTAGANGCGVREGVSFTLNTIDRQAVYSFDPLSSNSMKSKNPRTSGTLSVRMYKGVNSDEVGPTYASMAITPLVRRLTPLECERLQGFPDNWTNISVFASDSARYKALGNSVAIPCVYFILSCLRREL